MASRQERAVEVVVLIERRGLRFKLDGDLIVVVTSAPIAPEELRQLVEKLGGEEGTHDDPCVAGVLMPYVLSVLKQRPVEEVALELRGKLAFSPEYGWGTVVERESESRLIFAMAERPRQLSLYPNNLLVIASEEQLRATPDGETKPSAEADPKPKRSFWEYFRGAASGKAD